MSQFDKSLIRLMPNTLELRPGKGKSGKELLISAAQQMAWESLAQEILGSRRTISTKVFLLKLVKAFKMPI